MELRTDDGKFITREDYRRAVVEIMESEKFHCMTAIVIGMAEHGMTPEDGGLDSVMAAANDALKLQLSVLGEMEKKLFGRRKKNKKPETDVEEPQVAPKDDQKEEGKEDV